MQPPLKTFLDNLSPEALNERLTFALDGSRLGIWDWDLTDNSVQFDARWCAMLGLDHATTPMTLETWSSRVHPDDLERCYADLKAHLERRSKTYENVHRLRHANGQWLSILDRGRISGRNPDGTPIRFTGTHFDITPTEEARRVLERHEQQLQDLVANLPTGVAMLDLERRYLAASPQWLTAHGLDARVLGRAFAEQTPALEARWLEPIDRALLGEASRADETCVQVRGQQPRWSRWDVRPWLRVDGTIGGVLISDEDITDRVLQREHAEKERNTRLTALALFAGGVAHELSAPLEVILSETQRVRALLEAPVHLKVAPPFASPPRPQQRIDPMMPASVARLVPAPRPSPATPPASSELPPMFELDAAPQGFDRATIVASLSNIDSTARSAAAISRALHTLSRDAREDPPGAVPLSPLLDDAMALCRSRFATAGVALTIDDRTGGVKLLGRPSELLHVVLNLLNNAFDAVANTAHPWIRLEAEVRDGTALVRCIDGGSGVPAENVPRLMTPFFTTKRHGTGIGLSVSRALAERDGGFLTYRPAPASTFELGVPVFPRV